MITTPTILRGWLAKAKKMGATHMIVACDDFDHEDYPVFVMPGTNPREKADEISKSSMQRVMECYSLARSLETQLLEQRAFHYD